MSDPQPRWLALTHKIRHAVWADWEGMPDCCPGCAAEWVRALVEPILYNDHKENA